MPCIYVCLELVLQEAWCTSGLRHVEDIYHLTGQVRRA